jgi:hypothetical protein
MNCDRGALVQAEAQEIWLWLHRSNAGSVRTGFRRRVVFGPEQLRASVHLHEVLVSAPECRYRASSRRSLRNMPDKAPVDAGRRARADRFLRDCYVGGDGTRRLTVCNTPGNFRLLQRTKSWHKRYSASTVSRNLQALVSTGMLERELDEISKKPTNRYRTVE